jgi:hypothetical protein
MFLNYSHYLVYVLLKYEIQRDYYWFFPGFLCGAFKVLAHFSIGCSSDVAVVQNIHLLWLYIRIPFIICTPVERRI